MTVITSISDRPNFGLVHVWKSIKKRSSFAKKKIQLCRSTCLTNHAIEWDKSKIIITNRRYHQHLCLEAWHISSAHASLNRWWWLPTWRLLTLRQKKGQVKSKHVKWPLVAAIRSSLMKALNKSVETLGLRLLTSRLHLLNLYTRVACLIVHLVALSTWLPCELQYIKTFYFQRLK